MSRFGIVAALPGELKPLLRDSGRAWRRLALRGGYKGDAAWAGQIGQNDCVAVAAGMGASAATRACAIAEQAITEKEAPLDALISAGWAGALSCGLSPGNAYAVAEVVDGQSQERFPTSLAAGSGGRLRLVTVERVAQPQEKRALAQHFQAVLVDMEGAAVARWARDKSIPFYCFKAVTDGYQENLPGIGRYTDAEGKLRIFGLAAYLALRPQYWRPMARVGNNCKIGARAIAQALEEFIANAR